VAAERAAGSNRGRAVIDWQEAFLLYASLPAEQRDYQSVADKFAVSRRTVERHGRLDHWKQRARELDQESVRTAAERLRDQRADKLIDTEKLVEATYISYANQLIAGSVKLTPNHLVKLFQLRQLIWGLQDDESVDQPEQVASPQADLSEHKLQVLRVLDDVGALQQLLHRVPADDQHENGRQIRGGGNREAGQKRNAA
jgi:hypothetical protein